jgi:hypothetical protein
MPGLNTANTLADSREAGAKLDSSMPSSPGVRQHPVQVQETNKKGDADAFRLIIQKHDMFRIWRWSAKLK